MENDNDIEEKESYTDINYDDIIDGEYVEIVEPATIDTLSSHYNIGRGSMNSLVVGLEKRKALSTWARPEGSWRKFTSDDLKVIDTCITLMRNENLSVAATVNKITGINKNDRPPRNNEEFYRRMQEASTQLALKTSTYQDEMKKMFQDAFEQINVKLEEAEAARKKMEEKLLEITSSTESEEVDKQQKLSEELNRQIELNEELRKESQSDKEEIEKLKLELQNEKNKSFFKKIFNM